MAFVTLLVTLAAAAGVLDAAPTVSAPWGRVAGQDGVSPDGRIFSRYLAIPFALPPVGDLRWKRPLRYPGPGAGILHNQTDFGASCPQLPGLLRPNAAMSEDCLTLNVFVPQQANSAGGLKGVMVWVHGGGFTQGSSGEYVPGQMVTDHDVIVVTVNYRLGILGFLATGDDASPGNYGLWDIEMALQWVKDNVGAFGGDRERVTIFGESAGAAAVGYQVLSPVTRGLFSRALLQSGTPVTSWALEKQPQKGFDYLANKTGCVRSAGALDAMYYMVAGGRERQMRAQALDCLARLDWSKFLEYTILPIDAFGFSGLIPWVPVADGDFVPKDPAELVADADYLERAGALSVDLVFGVCNQEAGSVLGSLLEANLPAEGDEFSALVRDRLRFGRLLLDGEVKFRLEDLAEQPKRADLITDVLEFFYLRPLTNGQASLENTAAVYNDINFNVPLVYTMRALAAAKRERPQVSPGRLYLYVFDHYPNRPDGQLPGTYHGDDLFYQFDPTAFLNRDAFDADMIALGGAWRKLVTSFAKNGNPETDAQWPEFEESTQSYLSFKPQQNVQQFLVEKSVQLWFDLVSKLYNATEPQQQSWASSWTTGNGGAMPFSFKGVMKIFKLQ